MIHDPLGKAIRATWKVGFSGNGYWSLSDGDNTLKVFAQNNTNGGKEAVETFASKFGRSEQTFALGYTVERKAYKGFVAVEVNHARVGSTSSQ